MVEIPSSSSPAFLVTDTTPVDKGLAALESSFATVFFMVLPVWAHVFDCVVPCRLVSALVGDGRLVVVLVICFVDERSVLLETDPITVETSVEIVVEPVSFGEVGLLSPRDTFSVGKAIDGVVMV